MGGVLLLFLLPVGGGIPAGVLLARARGLSWPLTAGLYLVSDVILAFAFEPLLRLLAALARRRPFLVRLREAFRASTAAVLARHGGPGAGPLAMVLLSFGTDPMTGRAAALAAGHGLLAGWAFAIAGDMLYYAAVAGATLGLESRLHHPELTVVLVLGAMLALPALVRRLRARFRG